MTNSRSKTQQSILIEALGTERRGRVEEDRRDIVERNWLGSGQETGAFDEVGPSTEYVLERLVRTSVAGAGAYLAGVAMKIDLQQKWRVAALGWCEDLSSTMKLQSKLLKCSEMAVDLQRNTRSGGEERQATVEAREAAGWSDDNQTKTGRDKQVELRVVRTLKAVRGGVAPQKPNKPYWS